MQYSNSNSDGNFYLHINLHAESVEFFKYSKEALVDN